MSELKRCPRGTRRNKRTRECEKMVTKERKNCPRGTRRNKKTRKCDPFVIPVKSVNDVCSICLGVIDDDKYKTKCKHTFHSKCLGAWCGRLSDGKKTCPYCREKIASDCKKIEPIVSSNIFPYLDTFKFFKKNKLRFSNSDEFYFDYMLVQSNGRTEREEEPEEDFTDEEF